MFPSPPSITAFPPSLYRPSSISFTTVPYTLSSNPSSLSDVCFLFCSLYYSLYYSLNCSLYCSPFHHQCFCLQFLLLFPLLFPLLFLQLFPLPPLPSQLVVTSLQVCHRIFGLVQLGLDDLDSQFDCKCDSQREFDC